MLRPFFYVGEDQIPTRQQQRCGGPDHCVCVGIWSSLAVVSSRVRLTHSAFVGVLPWVSGPRTSGAGPERGYPVRTTTREAEADDVGIRSFAQPRRPHRSAWASGPRAWVSGPFCNYLSKCCSNGAGRTGVRCGYLVLLAEKERDCRSMWVSGPRLVPGTRVSPWVSGPRDSVDTQRRGYLVRARRGGAEGRPGIWSN